MRYLKNPTEEAFRTLAEQNGWKPSKRGWPDFVCFGPNGKVIAVEVKPRLRDGSLKTLGAEQARTLDALSTHGIDCYLSDGKILERYDRAKHRREPGDRLLRPTLDSAT